MTLEEMKRRRRELGYTYQKLSELSEVPLGTVQKIFGGITSSPRYETMQALEKVLDRDGWEGGEGQSIDPTQDRAVRLQEHGGRYEFGKTDLSMLREEIFTGWGKEQGEFTVEDLGKLPEEQRVELIDGVLYDMSSAPTYGHQRVIAEIQYQIERHIREHGSNCEMLSSPYDVQLDRDNRTMVEPDLMITCHKEDITYRNYQGAPDYILEVLSPSTRKKDLGVKLRKYQAAGVREYWMVDVDEERVIVHVFDGMPDIRIYRFDTPVPLGICESGLRIDLSHLTEILAEVRERDEQENTIG